MVSVLLFHFWPEYVPGGYVGVDVFFVISGYLITGILIREAESKGSIDLPAFYRRRIRRLLPTAMLVLAVTTVGLPLLPVSRWGETAIEIIASATYWENWRLAWLSVDYLGSENAPSPVQHYWSLAIEEQFYLVYPVLIAASLPVGKRLGGSRRTALGWLVALATAISFACSVLLTASSADSSYFLTHTRVWELGVGALIALNGRCIPVDRGRNLLLLVGVAMIFVAVLVFNSDTSFPGYAALLPVLGAAAVVWSGVDGVTSSGRLLLGNTGARFVGDCSYSLYLWHWPLLVFFGWEEPTGLGHSERVLLLVVVVLVASLSQKHVEDRFRSTRNERSAVGSRTFWYAGSAVGGVSLIAGLIYWMSIAGFAVEGLGDVRLGYSEGITKDDLIPPLINVKQDLPEVYELECHADKSVTMPKPCIFGSPTAALHVAVVGDSHAANWIPAMILLSERNGWRLETYTKSSCPFVLVPVVYLEEAYSECIQFNEAILDRFDARPPDLIVHSQARVYDVHGMSEEEGFRELVIGIRRMWTRLGEAGTTVVAVVDTPYLPFDPPDCLSDGGACETDAQSALGVVADPLVVASAEGAEASVHIVDMNRYLCNSNTCFSVAGNVVIWRDYNHLTATYSRVLAPALHESLWPLLERGSSRTEIYRTNSSPSSASTPQ